jgi:hypothetical protein
MLVSRRPQQMTILAVLVISYATRVAHVWSSSNISGAFFRRPPSTLVQDPPVATTRTRANGSIYYRIMQPGLPASSSASRTSIMLVQEQVVEQRGELFADPSNDRGAPAVGNPVTNRATTADDEDGSSMNDWTAPHHTDNEQGLPSVLLELHLYGASDFVNQQGVVPTFWGKSKAQENECFQNGECKQATATWGPCYQPEGEVDWYEAMDEFGGNTDDKKKLQYLPQQEFIDITSNSTATLSASGSAIRSSSSRSRSPNLANFCRPGFLIIGGGKCGTSSLYHYLVGHPRVLAASQKQVHYFKNNTQQGLKWYLGHFPSATSFLAKGALMTGEASPGYLPYPGVAAATKKEMDGTKIICVGRDPIERAWSSYRYNYVNPALELMRNGQVPGVDSEKGSDGNDAYYTNFLYSFEDMLRAELKILRACLAVGGFGSEGTRLKWGNEEWAQPEYARRAALGLAPLVDLDGQCYGDFISAEVPRKQWQELVDKQPGKFLNVPSIYLSQAMLGRSLYVYALEWWYALFDENIEDGKKTTSNLYFLCTEEMRDKIGKGIDQVGQFLGLPEHNFSTIVSQGMFNVAGHKGYNTMTSWDTVADEKEGESSKESGQVENHASGREIPLSDDFRAEVLEFLKPHNERLFDLIGKRCDWS